MKGDIMIYTTIQELRRNCLIKDLRDNGNGSTSIYLDEKTGRIYTVVGTENKDGSYTNNISYK
jgi:hypothetical protein